jgi:hypothetical protein
MKWDKSQLSRGVAHVPLKCLFYDIQQASTPYLPLTRTLPFPIGSAIFEYFGTHSLAFIITGMECWTPESTPA